MSKIRSSQENLSILLLGTGGTIAGLGGDAYVAAQLPIVALVPASKHQIVSEQIDQIDSKDMSFDVWERLYARITAAQNDASCDAIVITHGTDTMEETAYFLHRTLTCTMPVILTGAMRPADAADSDGPQNMAFALAQAQTLGAGVLVAFAGKVFSGGNVQKVHSRRLDAFDVVTHNAPQPLSRVAFPLPVQRWPRVEVVMSYAGASGNMVDALVAQKVDGIVVAGTGNSTVHQLLETSLDKARAAGVVVSLCSRCLHSDGGLSPVQARVELILRLLG
jgi:L-asparaginase